MPSNGDAGAAAAARAAAPNGAAKEAPAENGSLRHVCLRMARLVDAFLEEDSMTSQLGAVQDQLRSSLKVVDDALDRYPLDQISISYNGGKDCLALLVIILACLSRRLSASPEPSSHPNGERPPSKLQAIYIVAPDPFAEVDDFVESSAGECCLDVSRYAMPMKPGLRAYLADRPKVKAVFVGTRRTDPHGEKLTHFDPTDSDWPRFMRIHPVIDWHYAEIWTFIRHLQIPYCCLYDQGYTSLGGTEDTLPNPHLKAEGDQAGFRPAYELVGDDEERLGRDR